MRDKEEIKKEIGKLEKGVSKLKKELILTTVNELSLININIGKIFKGLSGSSMSPCKLKFKSIRINHHGATYANVVKVKKNNDEYDLYRVCPFDISVEQLKKWCGE